ncbi:MAG: phospholipase A [Colwellia sp.]
MNNVQIPTLITKTLCSILFFIPQLLMAEEAPISVVKEKSILENREKALFKTASNPFSISQHRLNYLLPVSYISNPGTRTVEELNDDNVDNVEAKYQISIKFPIYLPKTADASGLYFGFTAVSYWQLYNSETSKPFRETNYEPELFYSWQQKNRILGFEFNQIQLGINHQSNGQSGLSSRSWNRVFASLVFSDESAFYYLKAWHRLAEEEKETPLSVVGDDNPDITNYLGHMELGVGTQLGKFNLFTAVRNNLKRNDNKGSVEFNLSYGLTEGYDILIQYFNGYGDSLIDYDRHQQRISLGMQMKFL